MDFEYIVLQKYLRESFPEHAELTLAEILVINNNKFNFIDFMDYKVVNESLNKFIIENLFMIDITEFFERNKNKLPCDFINENSFEYSSITDNIYYFDLEYIFTENTGIFLEHDLYQKQKNNELFIKYKNKKFEYNKYNFDLIMLEFISDIKKNRTPENLLTLFLYEYIKHDTDLTDFFHIMLLNNDTITIATHYNLSYLNESNNLKKNNINIVCVNKHISILDYNSNVLFKKEIEQITKDNFFNEIIEPLKNIIIDKDNIRKKDFQLLWKQDFYFNISSYLDIEEKDLNDIKIEVFLPQTKSDFLGQTVHSQRPEMAICFVLNECIITPPLKIKENYRLYYDDIMLAYELYKNLKELYSEKIILHGIIGTELKQGKMKRI